MLLRFLGYIFLDYPAYIVDNLWGNTITYSNLDDINDKKILKTGKICIGQISGEVPKNAPTSDIYAVVIQINSTRTIQLYFSRNVFKTRIWYDGDNIAGNWC